MQNYLDIIILTKGGKGTTRITNKTTKKTNDILNGKFPDFQTYQLKQKLIKLRN